MTEQTTVPHGENLRNAIRWLSEQILYGQATSNKINARELIEKASVKFDLTPLEEDFLMRKFVTNSTHPDIQR